MEIIYLYLAITWLMGIGFMIKFNTEDRKRRLLMVRIICVPIVIVVFPAIAPIKWGVKMCD